MSDSNTAPTATPASSPTPAPAAAPTSSRGRSRGGSGSGGRVIAKWLGRLASLAVVLVIALAIAGALYQTVGLAGDQQRFPPPGKLFGLPGYWLHLYCLGDRKEGSPTVVLETTAGGVSPYWGWVQPAAAKDTEVCSYDRAGRAWSDRSPNRPDGKQIVEDLHDLLVKAGVAGPFVLVGHSIGGLYVRMYAAKFPEKVVGMVLVDAAHPDQNRRSPRLFKETDDYLGRSLFYSWMANLGLFRLSFARGETLDFGTLPPQQLAEVKAIWSTGQYFTSQRAELIASRDTFDQAQALGPLGDLPLAVVSAGRDTESEWPALQDELAQLSTNSSHHTVADATHTSLVFAQEPASAVVAAIHEVVEAVRTKGKVGGH